MREMPMTGQIGTLLVVMTVIAGILLLAGLLAKWVGKDEDDEEWEYDD